MTDPSLKVTPGAGVKNQGTEVIEPLLRKSVLLDIETDHGKKSLIKIGARRGHMTFYRSGAFQKAAALRAIDHLANGASSVIGHNLVAHDLAFLHAFDHSLQLLKLPVIDTLYLSPICFPQNPYHRLVKDYKLVSESRNDPVADCHAAAMLLADEFTALQNIRTGAPDVYRCLQFLLCATRGNQPDALTLGMRLVFESVASDPIPSETEALAGLQAVLPTWSCHAAALKLSPLDLATADARWAMAYVLTWLRVAGGNSVLPPWVRLKHLAVSDLLRRFRETPCDDPSCAYCQSTHNPETQLNTFFGFEGFRPSPADSSGQSLQRAIVRAGMRDKSLLAIMPTGGGKSLCFQLPALIRNVRRGQLTVVVSPLQALMKDQVDGLIRRTGLPNVAALNGLLTSPERGAVLRGIRMGDIALLYVSPEQLRSRAVRNALRLREIGCWVLDEAHCLSKWGHDFRPDYLYVGRFIRELAKLQDGRIPPVACFTATAKRDVVTEILDYFQRETGQELVHYEGGVERDNLQFNVLTVGQHAKLPRIEDLLRTGLAPEGPGAAVVFRATRRDAEDTAAYLKRLGWRVAHFHAGMSVPDKKSVQDAFLADRINVICATNAFGMGIDKDDVRLVIHGDTPSSLENYLQEAGRAGRDRQPAECILLYDEEDCEQQFRIGAYSQLTRNDIAQILRALRTASNRRKQAEVVITTGEILRDEDIDVDFHIGESMADTKVRSAVSWLERSGFLERNENETSVFQARLLVKSLDDAEARLARLDLSDREKGLWLAIVRELLTADQTDLLSVDQIAMLPEFQSYHDATQSRSPAMVLREGRSLEYLSAKVYRVLESMTSVGLLKKDTLLTAFVRYKVTDHSGLRLEKVLAADRELLKLLPELEPDPEGWMPLDLRQINQALLDRDVESSTELVRRLLTSLSEDGRGFSGQKGSLELRFRGRDQYRVKVVRDWARMTELAERRRQVAEVILAELLRQIPDETRPQAGLLVEFTFEQLEQALARHATLHLTIRDMLAAIERGLMFLHEQEVIILQKGLAIFRSAMTIRLLPEAEGQRYTTERYQALQHHYRERTFQVHVINEYARYGLEKITEALQLVLAYFTADKENFIQRYFGDRRDLLKRATTARSYKAIVEALNNRDQIRIVTAPAKRNMLILAGPGSGKTRTVVHRCAFLLRVMRVRPRAILVCCFNHKAALELRRRLADLVGKDAIGVTIQTYHGLALRILGQTSAGLLTREAPDQAFDQLIVDAIQMLRAEKPLPGVEPDEVRDRLLAGFEHILVDEYQDIDAPQYDLISAIAGRTIKDDDRKLSILAVGDDDQSIYGFRGANVEFIRRFQQDYNAEPTYLVENYRSTNYIIEAANRVIGRNRDRMKTEHPIRIDQGRSLLPPGGMMGQRDPLTRGRVAIVPVRDIWDQAENVAHELERLRDRGGADWTSVAVLSRTKRDLALVRAAAEARGIPVSWPLDRSKTPPLHRIREIERGLETLAADRVATATATELMDRIDRSDEANPWQNVLTRIFEAWRVETGDEPTPVQACIEFIYETLMQRRRDEQFGHGVILNTVHAAKGTEYDHVFVCGDWSALRGRSAEEERRILYVGMTRARQTLTIFNRQDRPTPLATAFAGPCFVERAATSQKEVSRTIPRNYTLLGLDDIFLDYAGRLPPEHPVHQGLAQLQPGDRLRPVSRGEQIQLLDGDDHPVAQLSVRTAKQWRPLLTSISEMRVLAMVVRKRTDNTDSHYGKRLHCERWDVPVCEVVCPDGRYASPRGSGCDTVM